MPVGPVVKNPPATERDMSSIPGPGRAHLPQATKPVPEMFLLCNIEPKVNNAVFCA